MALPRPARPGIAVALALMLAAAGAPFAMPVRARADAVRDDQAWVLNAVGARAAWKTSQGKGVIVAVIDSGVEPVVSDLQGQVTSGPDYTGVGTSPGSPGWGVHGTWMASLVAGHGHVGGSGILGTAPQAQVLSIRVITDRSDPGYVQYQSEPPSHAQLELARAIRYAVAHRAGVISMSLGYSSASRAVRAALQHALARGVVVVASSGNSGDAGGRGRGHAPYSFPADYPGVLGVAAVSRNGSPAAFSSQNLSVQVAAPGVDVPAQGRDGQYWLVSGTSPACALTAGVAALIKSRYPALSPAVVREAIISTTHRRPPGGYDDQVGFGTVDAGAAMAAAGRLAGQGPAQHGVAAAYDFGGGRAGVPPVPVSPRGPGALILLLLLGTGCLAILVIATLRLISGREPRPDRSASPPPGGSPGGGAGRPGPEPDGTADGGPGVLGTAGLPLGLRQLPASRLPWQAAAGGRHAAPGDRREDAGIGE